MNCAARESMLETYVLKQVNGYLLANPGADRDKVSSIVQNEVTANFKDKHLVNVIIEKGEYVLKKEKLSEIVETTRDKVIAPSGSIYFTPDVKESVTSRMLRTRVSERDAAKLAGFVATQRGDHELALSKHFEQSNKKVMVNSLPGAFNAPQNVHCDRGNYNAITSIGRAIIKSCYTVCEQLLGGNFHWKDDDAVVNYIETHLSTMPPESEVMDTVHSHKLKIPTVDETVNFILTMVDKYSITPSIPISEKIVRCMTEPQRTYFYYVNNLKHLIIENEVIFKPMLKKFFDIKDIKGSPGTDPNELLEMDENLLVIICSNAYMDLRYTSKDGRVKNRTLPEFVKNNPDGARRFIAIGRHFESILNPCKLLMDVLIDTDTSIADIQTKQNTVRNTIIGSDTDSCIFSCHKWVEWYTGEPVKTTPGMYEIASIVIYWLVMLIKPTLHKFSVDHGVTDSQATILKMKNEFLQPIFMGFSIKKQDASIVSIIEGNVLVEPKINMKGLGLKSSTFTKKTLELINVLVVKDILMGAQEGPISGKAIINKCLRREVEIIDSLKNGEMDFLKSLSANPPSEYKNPMSSNYAYVHFWNEVYAKSHGKIEVPSKPIMVTLSEPTIGYIDWLKENYPVVYNDIDKLLDYIWSVYIETARKKKPNIPEQKLLPKNILQKWKKCPSKLAINGEYNKVPKSIISLIAVRDIVFQNMKPIYVILESLGIVTYTTNTDKKLTLLSDQYEPY